MDFWAQLFGILMIVAFAASGGWIFYQVLKQVGIIKFKRFIPEEASAKDVPHVTTAETLVGGRWLYLKSGVITFFKPLLTEKVKLLLSITGFVLISRLIIFGVGYLSVMLMRNETGSFLSTLHWMWNKWDAGHLINIAEHWYVNNSDEKYFIVFYPLYPMIVRFFNFVTQDSVWSGFIVSNISLVFAGYYLYRLVGLDYGDKIARNAVKYLLIFPVSFFLSIVYTDSLFLALSVMAFYFMRRNNGLMTGICGGLAALTRNFGILLIIPAVIECLISRQSDSDNLLGRRGLSWLWLVLIPLGTGIYFYINKVVTGDWFTFLTYQSQHWNNQFGFFGTNLKNYFMNAFTWKPADRIALWIPQVVAVLSAVGLMFLGMKKLRISYLAYFFAYIFICASSTWLISAPRYIMSLFPIYIILALCSKNRTVNAVITFSSIMLLCFYTFAFILDFGVM